MTATKKLMIGKCNEVFLLRNTKVPGLLSAKTKEEFILAKENIQQYVLPTEQELIPEY
jgi:hypothetical protein